MIGYKALNEDFTARNMFKYELGKTYKLDKDEKLEICKCGFHFCKNPIDVYGYYPKNNNIIIVKVEALGDIVQEGTKYATNKIKVLREYTREELDKLIVDINHNTGDDNTGYYNSGNYNTGNDNSGTDNTGNRNSGRYNTGDDNTGYYNTGNCNTGDRNSGRYNSGSCNTGHYNTGKCNSGNYNTGSYNSGDSNTGHFNTGYYNRGKHNTGHFNSGNYNTGYYNSGNFNTGIFNTGESKMMVFNKLCDMTYSEFFHSIDYDFYDLCYRIRDNDLFPEDRARIEALPNYDPDIFTEITGIKFD